MPERLLGRLPIKMALQATHTALSVFLTLAYSDSLVLLEFDNNQTVSPASKSI